MARVIWSLTALADLRRIHAYLQERSESAGEQLVRGIVRAPRRLERFPLSGRVVPELGQADIREILFDSYRILYRVTDSDCHIQAVVHGRRDLIHVVDPDSWEP